MPKSNRKIHRISHKNSQTMLKAQNYRSNWKFNNNNNNNSISQIQKNLICKRIYISNNFNNKLFINKSYKVSNFHNLNNRNNNFNNKEQLIYNYNTYNNFNNNNNNNNKVNNHKAKNKYNNLSKNSNLKTNVFKRIINVKKALF